MKSAKNAKDKPSPKPTNRPTEGPTPEQISALAHAIWERQGRPEGHDIEHWLLAEAQIRQNPRPTV